MDASELKLVELLDFVPERGRISFRDHRMLLWDADAFGSLRKELFDNVGVDAARGILRRFGFANGYRDALSTKQLFSWPSDAEWWRSCPVMQGQEGKVRAEVEALEIDKAGGRFELAVRWHDSYEAAQHVRVHGAAHEPVCWTLAGYASGFSTAVMGEEVFVVEEQCAAAGHDSCRVVGRTRRQWGADGEHVAREYQAPALAFELEAREKELRRTARQLEQRERDLRSVPGAELATGFATRNVAMQRVLELVDKVAQVDVAVLITGESGVGKERISRRIHERSARAPREFVAINCGALPEALLESELFGHVRGAFTGAVVDKKGLFEAARGGTIFLDEVGEMTAATQVKLLRVLQEREVRPVGATASIKVGARVVAATNRNLTEMVAAGSFRQDLYYRLKVVHVAVPPLRERREDILVLARTFVERASAAYGIPARPLSPDAAHLLVHHAWPGNVRELENAIEHAMVLAGDAPKLTLEHLPAELSGTGPVAISQLLAQTVSLEELERRYILLTLERHEGSRIHTARALGIGTNTLWRKLKRWGIPASSP